MRALRLSAYVLIALVAVLGLAFAVVQTTPGKRFLASLASDLASSPDQKITITGIDGFVPTDLHVARVEIADRTGPWLQVENAQLSWSFASLLQRRLRINLLSAAKISVLRAPQEEKKEATPSNGGLRLPFDIDLRALRIDDLQLAAALGGIDSHWKIGGEAAVASDLGEIRAKLGADRLEGPKGKLTADVRVDRSPRKIAADITLDEDPGGMVAALMQRPDLPDISLKLSAQGDPRDGTATLTAKAGDKATARGNLRWMPDGSDTSFQADLDAGPIDVPAQGVAWKRLHLEAGGKLTDAIRVQGQVEELKLATLDPRFPQPGTVTVDATVSDLVGGKIKVRSFEVGMPLLRLKGDGDYVPADDKGEVRATLDLPSLEPLSALAGRALSGKAEVQLTAGIDKGNLSARWQGRIDGFGAPDVPKDLVATVNIAGNATLAPDGNWTIRDAKLGSDSGTLTVSGRGREQAGTLDLALDLPRLAAFRAEVGGAATATATVGFGGPETSLKLKVESRDVSYQKVTSRHLVLDTGVSLATDGKLAGTLKAEGDVAGQPLSLDGRFSHDQAAGLSVPSLQGRWSSAVLDVANLAIAQTRTTGHARLAITQLKDIEALAALGLEGSLVAEVTADPNAPAGRLDVSVKGTDLAGQGLGAGTLDLRGHVEDPAGRAATNLTLDATRLRGAGGLSTLKATAKGDRPTGIDVAVQGSGPELSADVAARIEFLAEEIRVALSRFTGRYRDIPLGLNGSTKVTVAGARIVIDPTSLRVGAGRVAVRGTLDPVASDLQAEIAGLPLALLDTFAPGTGLEGTLQAKVRATGAMATPRLEATYSAAGVRVRRPDAGLIPALSLQGTGSLVGQQASLDARLSAGGNTNLTVKGTATVPGGGGSVAARIALDGSLDIAPFAPLLGNDIRNVSGRLRPNLSISIDGKQITGTGAIDFEGGAVAMPETGLRLSNGQGRFVLQGDTLQVQRLTFQAGTGTVTGSGSMHFDAERGLVLDLGLATQRALLVSRPDMVATISSTLKITGATSSGIEVSGPVTIDRAEISVGGGQTASFPTLDVREINKPGAPIAAAQPAPGRRAAKAPPPPDATPIKLALDVRAPQAIFVRGRGLDAEMSGQLTVGGSPSAPAVIGGFTMRRGTFSLGSRRLTFSKGIVTLDNLNTIDPRLDFLATTTANSTTIGVAITGTSREPKIEITSTPSMPPDEAMALLIFGKPASQLGASELIQVAQALAELAGQSPGEGVLGRLRKGLGLDQLSIGSSSSKGEPTGAGANGVSLEAGRYVAPGVYVGARQGAAGNSSRGVVQLDVFDNIKVEGDIGANSTGRVGVKAEWDY
ncbi:translocation/assembly module TamB domain-containing protein [Reyranella sp.]|uniref:translocation/assembly module TamB domain-containing protein n=1 Tax=Reyranella sp. TaxID=1929291 RepID=UPI003D0E99BD